MVTKKSGDGGFDLTAVDEDDIIEIELSLDFVAFDSSFHFVEIGNFVDEVVLAEYYSYSFAD